MSLNFCYNIQMVGSEFGINYKLYSSSFSCYSVHKVKEETENPVIYNLRFKKKLYSELVHTLVVLKQAKILK